MLLNTASHLPDMVARVFAFQAFTLLFCLKAVIHTDFTVFMKSVYFEDILRMVSLSEV